MISAAGQPSTLLPGLLLPVFWNHRSRRYNYFKRKKSKANSSVWPQKCVTFNVDMGYALKTGVCPGSCVSGAGLNKVGHFTCVPTITPIEDLSVPNNFSFFGGSPDAQPRSLTHTFKPLTWTRVFAQGHTLVVQVWGHLKAGVELSGKR